MRRDRERWSSRIGGARSESVRAAERMARMEAERLDLNMLGGFVWWFDSSGSGSAISACSMTFKDGGEQSGCERRQSSPLEVERGLTRFSGRVLTEKPGVEGMLSEAFESSSSSKDGVDSVETDRGPKVTSLS